MRYIYSEERLPIPENGEKAICPLLFEVIGRKGAGAEWKTSSGALGLCWEVVALVCLLQELFARKTAATSLLKRRRCENDRLKVHIRSRVVTVEGPRGKLVKDLSHIAVTFGRPEKNVISIEMHHGARKGVATLRTVRTLINNLIIGVTRGFKYKMRYVYAHFPINVNIEKNSETGQYEVEIRNFLGEKIVRRVTAQPGVEVAISSNVKDELQLTGNSLEAVSQSAADIQQICRVRNKDIRKFLDGLYVSERGNIVEE
ncbi:60S ribosomal protein L9B [Aspergillus fumigatus]|nr:60S ribosomal protein L9B [Aspergillus fumigatus]KAH1564538.1 60S ribosomal protein L9B [Aspergillus fumigatus]KAH1652083.1 60S ribosomal protein L9B [Aspergillus fumigatus]KAH2119897.1 60S ribosomal protein L9B [Aspergillus fumigatus]KAH2159128.1 60S ribosomal protein L9B [Aspergillus fumigatus]